MERRNFIKAGSIAGLGSLLITSHQANGASSDHIAPNKVTPVHFELEECTIADLQRKMESKTHTSRSITELYIKRIDAIDKNGPKLNAIIELNKEALSAADRMDKERRAGNVRGPMHGIPVLLKDNIDTGDQMHTTAGSIALSDNIASNDAFIVGLLREAGAVIVGKTNLSEWANFRSNSSTSGWSSRGGQTKNPYVLDRNPSGSSAGSGAAVAANLCAVAIGTETDGSIVSPCSVSGLVGIKPTVGLLSRSGIIPISKTQDTAGPMARTVEDAATLLGILTGVDSKDAATLLANGKSHKDYRKYLTKGGLEGKRLGLEVTALKGNSGMLTLLNNAREVLQKCGATIVEISLNKELEKVGRAEFEILLYEFKDGLNQYLGNANSKLNTLADLIKFNKLNEGTAMPFFKQETLILAQEKGDLKSAAYSEALKSSKEFTKNVIDTVMKKEKLDAIIGPTNGFAVCIDLINGDYDNGFSFSSPAARAGYPHITVPMGSWHDLPMGLSFFGMAYTEPELISMAYAYEQNSKRRSSPQFLQPIV
jgi:amidase